MKCYTRALANPKNARRQSAELFKSPMRLLAHRTGEFSLANCVVGRCWMHLASLRGGGDRCAPKFALCSGQEPNQELRILRVLIDHPRPRRSTRRILALVLDTYTMAQASITYHRCYASCIWLQAAMKGMGRSIRVYATHSITPCQVSESMG